MQIQLLTNIDCVPFLYSIHICDANFFEIVIFFSSQMEKSNSTHVYLYRSDLNTEGTFGCEVSLEKPSFQSIKAEADLRIYGWLTFLLIFACSLLFLPEAIQDAFFPNRSQRRFSVVANSTFVKNAYTGRTRIVRLEVVEKYER